MMPNHNMRNIKVENNKNTKHLKHRRVSAPRTNMDKRVNRPYQHEFINRTFKNDIYFSMQPMVIIWSFIRNIALHIIPAVMLHGLMFVLDNISKAVLGSEYTTPESGIHLLLITYGVCLFFGLRKFSDHMAYFNVAMLVSKHNINQTMLTHIYRSTDTKNDKELTVMDHYRKKFNKHSLFPSVKELAVEEQLYKNAYKTNNDSVKQYAELRRERLNLSNKRDEHVAAKEIADWKQEQFGGVNEYHVLVKKYRLRTIPAIKDIIDDVQ